MKKVFPTLEDKGKADNNDDAMTQTKFLNNLIGNKYNYNPSFESL